MSRYVGHVVQDGATVGYCIYDSCAGLCDRNLYSLNELSNAVATTRIARPTGTICRCGDPPEDAVLAISCISLHGTWPARVCLGCRVIRVGLDPHYAKSGFQQGEASGVVPA